MLQINAIWTYFIGTPFITIWYKQYLDKENKCFVCFPVCTMLQDFQGPADTLALLGCSSVLVMGCHIHSQTLDF